MITTFFGPPQKQWTKHWSSSFLLEKKKRPKNPGCQSVSRSHHHPRGASSSSSLVSFFVARDYKRLYKYCCSLSLSLSLARARKQQQLAFFGRSTPKRRLQQLLKRFSSPTKEREREIPRRKRYRLYRHKFDRSLQNRTPKRSALETEKTRPCSSSQKKKLEAIGTIRTFFGTWTLFVIGAVVKVVEVIIIIF